MFCIVSVPSAWVSCQHCNPLAELIARMGEHIVYVHVIHTAEPLQDPGVNS